MIHQPLARVRACEEELESRGPSNGASYQAPYEDPRIALDKEDSLIEKQNAKFGQTKGRHLEKFQGI